MLRPPIPPRAGRGGQALRPWRRPTTRRRSAGAVTARPGRGTAREGRDGVADAAPRLMAGPERRRGRVVGAAGARPIGFNPRPTTAARPPQSPSAAGEARRDDRGQTALPGTSRVRLDSQPPWDGGCRPCARRRRRRRRRRRLTTRARGPAQGPLTSLARRVVTADHGVWSASCRPPDLPVVHHDTQCSSEVFHAFIWSMGSCLFGRCRLGLPQEHQGQSGNCLNMYINRLSRNICTFYHQPETQVLPMLSKKKKNGRLRSCSDYTSQSTILNFAN